MTAMISMPALIGTGLRNSVNRIRDLCTLEQKLVHDLARMAIEFIGDSFRAPCRPARNPAFDSSHEPVDPFAPGLGAREAATQLLH